MVRDANPAPNRIRKKKKDKHELLPEARARLSKAMKHRWLVNRDAMIAAIRGPRPMSPSTKRVAQKIKRWHWEKNMSLRQIARKLDITYASLQWYLRRFDIPRRGRVESMNVVFNGHGPNWKGGRISSRGYVQLKMPNHPNADSRGYVYEHRYIMAKVIGRPIRVEEIVHHVNGDIEDNRIENLELRLRYGKEKPHGPLTICPHCHHRLR